MLDLVDALLELVDALPCIIGLAINIRRPEMAPLEPVHGPEIALAPVRQPPAVQKRPRAVAVPNLDAARRQAVRVSAPADEPEELLDDAFEVGAFGGEEGEGGVGEGEAEGGGREEGVGAGAGAVVAGLAVGDDTLDEGEVLVLVVGGHGGGGEEGDATRHGDKMDAGRHTARAWHHVTRRAKRLHVWGMLPRLGRASFTLSRSCLHSGRALAASNASQKIYRARVNTLLFGADRLLLTPRADTLEAYLMTKLSDGTFDNTYRAMAFMRLVRFALERHLFDVALALYDRMLKEGFLAVHPLSLRMTALKIAQQAANPKDIIPPLRKLFEEKAYDVPAFMDLVHFLSNDTHASGTLVDDLAHAFVSIRHITLSEYPDLVGELASINMRANRLDAAQKWLQIFEDTCGAQGVLPDVAPYSDVISTLNDIQPNNGDAIQDVLVRMRSAGASPDATVFNALIRVNFVQHRYQEAFALYHVLMEKRSDELMPNDVTYKMLFRATNLLSHPRMARRHKRPENGVPPRRLFREMLGCHLERTQGQSLERSTVVSVSAFHLALRTFMAREDYAAAFVVIRALHAFGFQPNLQTYLIVFVNLLQRMKHEANLARPEGAYRLVDFLTHLHPSEDPDLHSLVDRIRNHQPAFEHTGPSPVGIETVSHLLNLGEPTRPTNDDLVDVPTLPRFPSKPHSRRRPPEIPTAAMLTGAADSTPHQRTFFSPVPLARTVYKALLGELFRKAVHRGGDWDWKGAAGRIVEETGREMIPEGVWRGSEALARRAESREGQGALPFAAARMRRRRRGARGGREIAFDFES